MKPGIVKVSFFISMIILFSTEIFSQNESIINGYISSEANNRPVEFATVKIPEIEKTIEADARGFFSISLPVGLYNLEVTAAGFESTTHFEVQTTLATPVELTILLKPRQVSLDEVIVTTRTGKTRESPVSLRNLGINEIQRNPGGNRDISKVVQALPGAGTYVSSGSFRNDLIIRGGGPAENKFFVDNIEIPNINHFSTQGASGGPVGLINVDMIRNVNFLTGAFEASKGNALSSVMDISLKNGRSDRWSGAFTLGTSDIGVRGEGPLSEKTTATFSARRSFLQLLFKVLNLPFLPTYNDFQFKTHTKFNDKVELSVLGLGAIDKMSLNKKSNKTEQQQYILGNIPNIEQWSYTIGSVLRFNQTHGNTQLILSRNMWNNRFFKYTNNEDSDPSKKVYDNNTDDIENHLKLEKNIYKGNFKTNFGGTVVAAKYITEAFNKVPTPSGIVESSFNDQIDFFKYGLYGQTSTSFSDNRFSASLGLRFDGAGLTNHTKNPLNQASPRLSLSYNLGDGWSLNGNTGLYQQLPITTILGYRNNDGVLVNQNEDLRYTQSLHGVFGVEKNLPSNLKISVEGFYKKYNHYPISQLTGISLANVGADYGIVGNEPVSFDGKGKSYGAELFVQQKLWKDFYGWLAYTYVRSFFSNADGNFAPSSWDQVNLLNMVLGKRFKRNWEAGIKFRYSGGSPYTPYDEGLSSLKSFWDASGRGFLDYSHINDRRIPSNYQVDFRIDKKWLFKKWNLNLYFDMQNATQAMTTGVPILTVERDADGTPKEVAGSDPPRYQTKMIDNKFKTFVETLGIIIGF